MTRVRRINVSQVEGDGANNNNTDEIRPYGELAVYVGDNNKLELLMFDGVRTHVKSKVLNKGTFFGGDEDSGDGNGYDTIKLVPDETLRRGGSDQYLIIDPTGPNHIHIRAGGTIDQSSADLLLGGEQQNVRVSDTNDSVSITTDLQYTWEFNSSGNLIIPGNIGSESAINIDVNLTDSTLRRWTFGEDGSFSLPGNLTISPIGNYAPINGTVMLQATGEQLGISTSGVGGGMQVGWSENSFEMGNVAAATFNEGDSREVKITTGALGIGLTAYEWAFGNDGNLTFPDGTIQTTAFTGLQAISKFVAVNYDGAISGSDDGITWTDYQSNLNNIRRVAVGPNKIVYIAASSANPDEYSLWYADTYDTEPTEVTAFNLRDFAEVKYFKSISKFIAVGNDGESPANPALYYSTDGVNWTTSTIDSTYLATFESYSGNVRFTDIAENSSGFFIISDSAYIGGFYLADIADTLDGSNHVDLSGLAGDPQDILWLDSTFFFPGWHLFVSGEGLVWYENSNTNPSTGTFTDTNVNVNQVLLDEIGISGGELVEFVAGEVSGLSVVMISTADGQIVYWPAVPAGPYVSVPKPYTSTITDWTSSATSAITYTNVTGNGGANGEKFTVTGSSVAGYNGTYYLGAANAVFTDSALTSAFDTSALDPFTGTATISWSNGQYIDALHYTGGIFYAGNDDEEVFISTNAGQTWTQVDQLTGLPGESDFINDIDSYVDNGLLNTGNITFSGVEIRGVPSEMKNGLIKLVPATTIEGYSFTDNGQFVQIYPTNLYDAPHIHIAAGVGPSGEGDIFLGDDDKYVQVNHNGQVSIQAYDANGSNSKTWYFYPNGRLSLPGALSAYVAPSAYNDTTIALDVNATINRIVPTTSTGGDKYSLADGVEGQIMYIVPGTGGEQLAEYTEMSFAHARWTNGNGVINEGTNVTGWLPFHNANMASVVLTLIFTDGYWNLPHNSFD